MDLVNSVTQNCNNTKITMENLPPDASFGGNGFSHDNDEDGDNSNSNGNNYSANQSSTSQTTTTLQMQAPTSAANQNNESTAAAGNLIEKQPPLPVAAKGAASGGGQPQQVPDYLKAIGMDPKKFWPKKYRFTREKSPGLHNPLSIAQRNFYENNGYMVIDDCSSQKLIETIKAEYKQSSLVSEFLVDKLVAKNGKLLQYVKCFCDERVMLMTHALVETFQSNEQAKAIMDNKQSQRQQLFRDWMYLPFRPIDRVVCAITAIEPLDHVILVVPGTHKVGQLNTIGSTLESITAAYETSQERSPADRQLQQRTINNNNNISKQMFECSPENLSSLVEKSRRGFKYVNLKQGQTIFYHPGLVHGFSDDLVNFRKRQLATIAYYAAADCEYVEMRRREGDFVPGELPISLAHFKEQDPSDYNSWINRPRLMHDLKASL